MTEIHKSTINCCVENKFAFLNTGSDLSSLMIHLNYTFNIVQSVIGQLSSDHSNIIESLTPFLRLDLLLEANNNTNCSSVISKIPWTDPIFISALTCLLIGLIMGLLIIIIKNLHTPSSRNTIIMIITMLLLGYGVVALKSRDQWYHVLIKDWLSIVTTIVAMILGGRTKVLSVKWRKILFGLACLFTLMGIIFTILGFVFRDSSVTRIVYQVFACASWCFVMFIVELYRQGVSTNCLFSCCLINEVHLATPICVVFDYHS
ncbi:hypothetical protein KSF78_0007859 [Schistosoma japonicum]|nr:hypothetical protein KSF78_0007859 [Schistosoma japonicum]